MSDTDDNKVNDSTGPAEEQHTTNVNNADDATVADTAADAAAAKESAKAKAEAAKAADTQAADADAAEADAEATEPSLADQLAERTEDLQRITAEYANFRRRTDRERQAIIATTKANAITEFLPVLDDLELADKHGDMTGPLKAISDKLLHTFEVLGVKRFGEPGDSFDPEIHEAVQDLSSGDEKAIGSVLRAGYMIGDRLVRTAMVIIDDPQDTAAEQAADDTVDNQ